MAVNTEERHGQESLENHKHMFNQGVNYELYNFLGVHKISTDDESGYVFAFGLLMLNKYGYVETLTIGINLIR